MFVINSSARDGLEMQHALGELRNAYSILIGTPEAKRRWLSNVKLGVILRWPRFMYHRTG
jgi:hypothetical protein